MSKLMERLKEFEENIFQEILSSAMSIFPPPVGPGEGVTPLYKELSDSAIDSVLAIEEDVEGLSGAVFKADPQKKIVYGVVLVPDEVDAQGDWMTAEDIEKAAHEYVVSSRTVGYRHERPTINQVVESYIAPQDFETTGQYGSQKVKKGSWILAVKVNNEDDWKKVVSGELGAFSVGGRGLRR